MVDCRPTEVDEVCGTLLMVEGDEHTVRGDEVPGAGEGVESPRCKT